MPAGDVATTRHAGRGRAGGSAHPEHVALVAPRRSAAGGRLAGGRLAGDRASELQPEDGGLVGKGAPGGGAPLFVGIRQPDRDPPTGPPLELPAEPTGHLFEGGRAVDLEAVLEADALLEPLEAARGRDDGRYGTRRRLFSCHVSGLGTVAVGSALAIPSGVARWQAARCETPRTRSSGVTRSHSATA